MFIALPVGDYKQMVASYEGKDSTTTAAEECFTPEQLDAVTLALSKSDPTPEELADAEDALNVAVTNIEEMSPSTAVVLTQFAEAFFAQKKRVNCGNGVLDQGEDCDDGNFIKEDGCSPLCELERDQ